MSTRHQRRKRAKAKREGIVLGLLQSQRAMERAAIVKRNKSMPRGEPVVMYDRFGVPHTRLGPASSFAQSSVDLVGMTSYSSRSRVEKFYNPADAKRIAKRSS